MKILLISGSLPPMKCGVGDYTAHLAGSLSRQMDTEVAVLTDVLASPIPRDFEFQVFPICRGWRMADVAQIVSKVRQWKPDVMHIQYPTQGYGRRYLPWLYRACSESQVYPWSKPGMDMIHGAWVCAGYRTRH